ncbi:MAG: OsmC family protein [Candidatus Heimdallarchaeota archaeon]
MEESKTISTYNWVKNLQGVVDNDRKQAVLMDLPEDKGGDNMAPSALEFLGMSLTGCIGTIYLLIAKKMRITVEKLNVVLEAEKGPEDPTIKAIKAKVNVKASVSEEKLQRCLETTMKTCPVGFLYENANVPIDVTLNVTE